MVTKKPEILKFRQKKEFDNLGVFMKTVLNKTLKDIRSMRIRSIIYNNKLYLHVNN